MTCKVRRIIDDLTTIFINHKCFCYCKGPLKRLRVLHRRLGGKYGKGGKGGKEGGSGRRRPRCLPAVPKMHNICHKNKSKRVPRGVGPWNQHGRRGEYTKARDILADFAQHPKSVSNDVLEAVAMVVTGGGGGAAELLMGFFDMVRQQHVSHVQEMHLLLMELQQAQGPQEAFV